MDKLKVQATSGGSAFGQVVELPQIRYEYLPEEVSTERMMASGKIVVDHIGYRDVVTGTWGYLPDDILKALIRIQRLNSIVSLTFHDPRTGSRTALFIMEPVQPKIFKWNEGAPVWENITLTFRSQEVRNDYS